MMYFTSIIFLYFFTFRMKCVGIPRGMEEGDPGVTQRVWTTEEMKAVKHAMGLI